MKTIVLAPDSFKGTLSSRQVCEEIAKAAGRVFPGCQVKSVPVADGGEGSVEAFLAAMGGERKELAVQGPFGEEMTGFYGLVEGGRTAIIEMAACAGLPLAEGRLDPERATTYGVGQLMVDAARSGCKKIILGLGGSCTNDGGCGAAAAAGARFFREDGEAFVPTGGTLGEIAGIDLTGLRRAFAGVEIVAMCDIDNPLYGEAGAAYIFGPQKGADPAMVERLDQNLRALEQVVKQTLGVNLAQMPGVGAAGGMGYGMAAFFGAKLQPGIETVLDTVGFDRLLEGADLVFSGEGRLDAQSVRGKVVAGVARRAKAAGVPLVALVGQIGQGYEPMYDLGLSAVFSINRAAQPLAESAPHAAENLRLAAENVLRLWQAAQPE